MSSAWVRAMRVATTEVLGPERPRELIPEATARAVRPTFKCKDLDFEDIITLDFETYFDIDYTLSKLSTSEYVRDERFKAQMLGIKQGSQPTVIISHEDIPQYLASIDWSDRILLCHNTAFDGFILGHHYGVFPPYVLDTLSMARGLHSNDIGGKLDDVAQYYKVGNKVPDVLDRTKGVVDWDDELYEEVARYCAQDVELTLAIFKLMHKKFPDIEMDLVDITIRMFTQPVLKVDIARVQIELQRELDERQALLDRTYSLKAWDPKALKLTKAEQALPDAELRNRIVKKVVGSNELFASLLVHAGISERYVPTKTSPTYLKKVMAGQDTGTTNKTVYAFGKEDADFTALAEDMSFWTQHYDLDNKGEMFRYTVQRGIIQSLIDTRLAVKSTTNITRAERFLTAGADDMPLPCGYSYFRAHTGRWGGNNKMNMQNLKRGGELRMSILAPKDHVICVVDSGQIEARVNGWLWRQMDLLEAFKAADGWDKKTMGVAHGAARDAYCKFGDLIYGREITTDDFLERHVGKVCVLGLGFQMGAPKLQLTLAKGALGGPPVHFTLQRCHEIVNAYRTTNDHIVLGWEICNQIIQDMAAGSTKRFGPLSWEKEKLWLPNGLALHYPDLEQSEGPRGPQWSYRAGKFRTKIYGGLLCENIVQALARNVVAEQVLEISKRQRVVMITHDEAATCVKAKNADLAFSLMQAAFRRPPVWAPDIPLNCEGGYAANYSK